MLYALFSSAFPGMLDVVDVVEEVDTDRVNRKEWSLNGEGQRRSIWGKLREDDALPSSEAKTPGDVNDLARRG